MSFFVPIAKIDEEQRLVFGVATAEEIDNANEIFDYDSSKPYIEEWSNSFIQKTNGKSCGNLRAMHSPISAGKLVELNFDDANKRVDVCAKIVDDNEWNKVWEGVYTGFSFSGKAVKRWQDTASTAKRYTLKPTELSLADKPCVPSAVFFDVVKADGTIEKREFKTNLEGSEIVPDNVKKNMYDVASLAQLLQSLNNIRSNAVWEAQNEGDNSQVPAKLKDAIDNLAGILVEMVQEESAELTASKVDASPDINKVGARNSKPDMDKIQQIHDHSVTLGAACKKCDSKDDNKEGDDMNKAEFDVEVKKILSPVNDAVQKLTDSLTKVDSVIAKMDDVEKRLAKIEGQPLPAKAVKPIPISKTDDNRQEEKPDEIAKVDDILADIQKNNPDLAAY